MNTTIKRAFLVLLVAIMALPSQAMRRMSMREAVDRKLISCMITKSSGTAETNVKRSGIRMDISLVNRCSEGLELVLESGRRFISSDSLYQNLIMVETSIIALNPSQSRVHSVYSYCINQNRSGPGTKPYHLGKMAGGQLLKLANFLGKHRIISSIVPGAVWVVTNGNDIRQLKGKSSFETRLVKNFLYDLTGRPRPPRSDDPLSYPAVAVQGEISWTLTDPSRISLFLLDSTGRQLGVLINGKSFAEGPQYYRFHYLDDALLPGSCYRLQLKEGETILKEMAVTGVEEGS